MMDNTDARLGPFLLPGFLFPASSAVSSRRTPAAPAPPDAPDSASPSIIAASMSSSLGYSCSAASYLREIGRSMFIATWWAWSTRGLTFLGTSRLIMPWSPSAGFELGGWVARWSCRCALPGWRRCRGRSYEHGSFHQADGPQVAVPPLDRVLLDVAVPAEQ